MKIWVLACMGMAACAGDAVGVSNTGAADGSSMSWDEFRAHPPVSWDEFRARVAREPVPPYRFVVDGDIAISGEDGLRAHYEAWLQQEYDSAVGHGQALTVRNVLGVDVLQPRPQRYNMSYCISNQFNARKPEVIAAMDRATHSWSDAIAVQFSYRSDQDGACNNANTEVLFNVIPVSASFFAMSFFPDDPRAARQLEIDSTAFTTTLGGRDFEGILRHELGHTLGFRHEHIFISCTTETSADSRQVTSYDVNSVMHYPQCRPSGTGGYRQTALDYQGAISLYGSAPISNFNYWADAPHARAVAGDFDGDGRTDIALVGGDGWISIPVAFSRGDGSFSVTNTPVANFPAWASAPGVQVVAGDVNGDGRADLVAAGGPGWITIPVALSSGDGSFTVHNNAVSNFPSWATVQGARLLAGDVNGDGRADVMLTGGTGWISIPVAFSNGDTTFTVTNAAVSEFPAWAQDPQVQAVVTDINADGRADIVLAGGSTWHTVPMAISRGDGSFTVTNADETNIPVWSRSSSHARLLAGDVNGDHRGDILLAGGGGWVTIPVGFSRGDGTLWETNSIVDNFPTWAQVPRTQIVSGDFNRDGLTDLAMVGGTFWWTSPVAFSNGDGTFRVTNLQLP